MKSIILAVVLIGLGSVTAVSVSAQDATATRELTSTYDQEKNETHTGLRLNGIGNSDGKKIALDVSVSFAGRELTKRPEDVIFIVAIASSGGYTYPDIIKMKVKVDDKNLSDVLMLNLDKRPMDELFLETIGTRMRFEVFKKLAQAKLVTLLIDKTTITIESADLAKFGELLKLIDK